MLIGLFSKMLSKTALLVKKSRLQTSAHALKKPIAIIKLFPRIEGCAGEGV